MHQGNFDLSLEEISKIEGHAAVNLKVREGKVSELKFQIAEYKRFYTQAIEGKDIRAIPQQVARICGTCSNAHLLCAIKAIEKALEIIPSPQTQVLRRLLNNGLIIRDHGLHLCVFALPDLLGKDSFLDLDENNPVEHQLLHDAFDIKRAGNKLGIFAGGRSVHAPFPVLGGFSKLPDPSEIAELRETLRQARERALALVDTFKNNPFRQEEDFESVALVGEKNFDFLQGFIKRSDQTEPIAEKDYGQYLTHTVIPYSQASGYKFDGRVFMVGALARINLAKDKLHPKTKADLKSVLELFPSKNIFDNNLAQAIEIVHCLDDSLEILESLAIKPETPVPFTPKAAVGTAAIEAPRGTLFYRLEITADGKIKKGKIVVPTGQNQISIENSLRNFVEKNLQLEQSQLALEMEKIIRAYDPCMSCASHFLKVKWL